VLIPEHEGIAPVLSLKAGNVGERDGIVGMLGDGVEQRADGAGMAAGEPVLF
jgi:hypothetical protein